MKTPPSNDARVSIIIVNYYSAGVLKRCLRCVAAQLIQPQLVVIVDNGDEPGALDFIAADYPAFKLISADNVGFAAGNNLALRYACESEWVALLNPDAFPEPDWLQRLLAAAQLNSDADFFRRVS